MGDSIVEAPLVEALKRQYPGKTDIFITDRKVGIFITDRKVGIFSRYTHVH